MRAALKTKKPGPLSLSFKQQNSCCHLQRNVTDPLPIRHRLSVLITYFTSTLRISYTS